MSRPCGPCGSEKRNEIDRSLLEMEANGETYCSISRKFGFTEDALSRHKANHLQQDQKAASADVSRATHVTPETKAEVKETPDRLQGYTLGHNPVLLRADDGIIFSAYELRNTLARLIKTNDRLAAGQIAKLEEFLSRLREAKAGLKAANKAQNTTAARDFREMYLDLEGELLVFIDAVQNGSGEVEGEAETTAPRASYVITC